MILVDTNVLPDLVTNDPVWANWSIERLDAAALEGPVVINDVIYADVSIRFTTIEAVDTLLEEVGITLARLPRAALFLAGKAFGQYRARWHPNRGAAGLFRRRACRRGGDDAPDARCAALPDLLSENRSGDTVRGRERQHASAIGQWGSGTDPIRSLSPTRVVAPTANFCNVPPSVLGAWTFRNTVGGVGGWTVRS
jgi:hypothetical protein